MRGFRGQRNFFSCVIWWKLFEAQAGFSFNILSRLGKLFHVLVYLVLSFMVWLAWHWIGLDKVGPIRVILLVKQVDVYPTECSGNGFNCWWPKQWLCHPLQGTSAMWQPVGAWRCKTEEAKGWKEGMAMIKSHEVRVRNPAKFLPRNLCQMMHRGVAKVFFL